MNDAGDPPLRPPPERSAASIVAWIAAALLVAAALVFAWEPPPHADVAAASLGLPALPSLPDPAAPSSVPRHEDDASAALPSTAASGTELIEVCGVGWVPPDASGAADRDAVAGDRDVLASQRALLDALRRRDGEVGDAMATVLELNGAGRDNVAGTPLQALAACPEAEASRRGAAECAGREEDRQHAAALVERLARLAAASNEPGVYALAMQECRAAKGQGSCALLSVDQWARVDDGNALPWLHILERARGRNDAAQIEDALFHVGAATRFEGAPFAIAGRVADLAGASEVDVMAALLVAFDGVGIAASRLDPYLALNNVCKGPLLGDANRRQACEQAAETLSDRSDSLSAVIVGAALGRRLGWPAERVQALRGLQVAAMDETNASMANSGELPSSCSSARRILASFARKARDGEVQTLRAWAASHGGAAAFAARLPAQPRAASSGDAAPADPSVAEAASGSSATLAAAAVAAVPVADAVAASAAAASPPEPAASAASATPYSAAPPPDR